MAVKAVSRDGHPVTGRVEFAVGEPSGPAAAAEPTPEEPPGARSTTTGCDAVAGRGADTGWRGRARWVWLVGSGFLVAAAALLLAARRSPPA